MKPILAKILAINILFLSCSIFSYSEEIIFPKKKPILSNEVINKKVSKNILVPKKKPIKLPIKKPKGKKEILKEKKITKTKGIIIPKSKPLIVKKSTSKIAKKSKYYRKKDFLYAKQAIQLMEKRKWKSAEKVAKKARDKSIYNLYNGDIY